ncbi:PTS system mannose-specific EIIAB component [Dyadobacter sp. CECT 9275]|uniref:PTS system mannose-specific EIIAB component n=1 Tax=Dyadobacter helix TaxID=2822344 RepID=A0A916JC56_9BACT|nr:hypothetical protein [Dyadobacter sp. CECT 9275]CAG5000396.1 PTS system mannose-specific EIIAB component [Dyadobacter sp. CECT 9275]
MRKFLIATHGTFAKGVQSSLDIIVGPMENVFLIQAYVEENKGIEDELARVMEKVSEEDELVVFTDLMGGSVTNQILRFALRENVHVVSGFNLPLLVDVMLSDEELAVTEVLTNAIQMAKEQIVYVNNLLTPNAESDFDD